MGGDKPAHPIKRPRGMEFRPNSAASKVELESLMNDLRSVEEIRAERDASPPAPEAKSQVFAAPRQDMEAAIRDKSLSGGDGSRAAPAIGDDLQAVARAETQVDANPTDAQKEAGNYKKGHVRFNGLDIAVENPRGSVRSGVDSDGEAWQTEMKAAYGYIKRTEGADGDQVDVYVGLDPNADRAFVVDQIDPDTGKFDEHKVILGATDQADAEWLYAAHFNDGRGPERMGAVTPMTMDDFRTWLKEGDTRKPLAYAASPSQAAPAAPIGVSSAAKPPDGVAVAEPAAAPPGAPLALPLAPKSHAAGYGTKWQPKALLEPDPKRTC